MSPEPLSLVGAPGSPYTRKMRAILRYRQIPFRFVVRNSKSDIDTPEVPVSLIPVLVFPEADGRPREAMIDSSWQVRRLEECYRERSVIPLDPVVAFAGLLIEDYADEWLTKAMFHYRWAFDADVEHAARILPYWQDTTAAADQVTGLSRIFAQRQVGRLGVVGSSPSTATVIEESYRRLLRLLDERLSDNAFVLGDRPSAADFGLYGQLTQLAEFDPTSRAVAYEEAPRVIAWTQLLEDLSGLVIDEAGWLTRESIPESLRKLLSEIGRVYAPFLLANADALERGSAQVECEIDGRKWIQKPFPYQAKCLTWIREAYRALQLADRQEADKLLADTGCEALVE